MIYAILHATLLGLFIFWAPFGIPALFLTAIEKITGHHLPYWNKVTVKNGIRDFTPEQRKQMAKEYEAYLLKRSCN